MSSNSRQFLTNDDLAMLDRVLDHGNFQRSDEPVERSARLEASRFLIATFQQGVTTETALRSSLTGRSVVVPPAIESMGYDVAAKIFAGSFTPVKSHKPSDDVGYQYGKRVEVDGSWTVYHVFTGVPAQFGSWDTVQLDAKTAVRALRILNTPERED
jgi:hypothetical protein